MIGGDNEIEIEIRGAIVQEFAKKHLKSLANSEPIAQALEATKNEITRTIADKCAADVATFKQTYGGSVHDVKLKPFIVSEIDRIVRQNIDNQLRATVEKSIEFWKNGSELDERVAKRFEYYANDMISTAVKAKLEAIKKTL